MYNTELALEFISQRISGLESYNPEQAAVESFAILRHMENVLFRVIANFKTNLKANDKEFKRGELRAYQESNRGDMRSLFSEKKWVTLNPVEIPVSKALRAPYLITSEHVLDLLKLSQYDRVIFRMSGLLHDLFTNNIPEAQKIEAAHVKLTQLWGTQGYVPNANDLKPYLVLEDRGTYNRQAHEVFGNLDEVTQTIAVANQYESYFAKTISDQTSLNTLEKYVDGLVNQLEHTGAIANTTLTALYDFLITFIHFLDAYGMFLQAAQIIEHGIVLCLKKFVATL